MKTHNITAVIFKSIALASLLAFNGCTNGDVQKGNFTTLFVNEMHRLGGRLAETNNLPEIHARWTFQSDSNGFQCTVFNSNFAELGEMTTQVFGQMGESGLSDFGAPYELYAASDVGIALIVLVVDDGVKFTCVRGMTNWIGTKATQNSSDSPTNRNEDEEE